MLHYCFAIGRADGNGHCWLVGSKARNARVQEVMVRLNGAFNRFDPVDKAMAYDPSSKEFVEEEDISKIPGVKQLASSTPDIDDDEAEESEPLDSEEADYAGDDRYCRLTSDSITGSCGRLGRLGLLKKVSR